MSARIKESEGKKTVSVNHPIVQKKIKRSLKLSIRESAAASSSGGFGLSYLAPFALALNATASQMGILHAIISILPSIVQLKASDLIKKFSRKKIVITGIIIKIFLWIPIILTGVAFYFGFNEAAWIAIGLIGLFYATAAIIHPVWFSWMGSLVPENKRGYYFSKRNRVSGFFGVITMIAAGVILDCMKRLGNSYNNPLGFTLLGFAILFILSASARIYSLRLLKKQYEPRLKLRKKDCFSLKQFLQKCTKTPFGKFSIFRLMMSFAVGIAGPFWAVYMLRDLGMSYIWYMMITVSAIAFRLIFLPMLGKFSDKYGNIKLMKMCTWLIVTTPLLWISSVLIPGILLTKIYLLIVPQLVTGLAWAGYDLASNNYVYDAVSSPKRSFGLSYSTLMVGMGTALGAGAGALVVLLDIQFMNILLFIFAISAFLRFLVAAFGLKLLHEVRHVKKFSYEFLIQRFSPHRGIHTETHSLDNIVKKNEHYT